MSTTINPPPDVDPVKLALAMVIISIIGVAIAQPFTGAMIRLRAHHCPKSISLDGEENRANPELKGIFHTIQRTMTLEGWWGIYKGAYATIISSLVLLFPTMGFLAWLLRHVDGSQPVPGTVSSVHVGLASFNWTRKVDTPMTELTLNLIPVAFAVVASVMFLPFTIIINRAIVTPYRLPFSIAGSLRILLSRRERRRPYLLYCTPGLAVATILVIILPMGTIITMQDLGVAPRNGTTRAIVHVAVQVFLTAWVVPLSVVMAKVSVQSTLLPAAGDGEQALLLTESAEEIDEDSAGAVRTSSSDEDVVSIRPALPKYSSFVNAIRTIVAEEGWQALYRGWIWTALGLLINSLGNIPDYRLPRAPQ